MGWCSGTLIAEKWFAQIKKDHKGKDLEARTIEMIETLEEHDWDCQEDMDDPREPRTPGHSWQRLVPS